MNFFEALMLICFGVSWPAAILKTYRAKNPAGKSLMFAGLVLIGYFCGIINKFVNHQVNWVLALYIADVLLVSTDTILVIYYRYIRKTETAANK